MNLRPSKIVTRHRSIRNGLLLSVLAILVACQNIGSPTTATSPGIIASRTIKPESKVTTISAPRQNQVAEQIVYEDLWERMRAGFQLNDLYTHESVVQQIEEYADNQRFFDLITERAAPFLYWIIEEIDRRQLPLELALLPIVESTFNPNARSREHAVGLWQFLGATGKSFGLQQDWWYDGRRDPRASTVAALDYLEVLYKQFDEDWLLALAAYNTGEGNLRKAIRRNGGKPGEIDFWDLRLSGETRAHIPKLLALAAVISNSEQHGIALTPLPNQPALQTVDIGSQIDISQAAKLAKMDYAELRALNPGYLQWATHPDHPQQLLLPHANASALLNRLDELSDTTLMSWDRYEILAGDTLGGIARKLGISVDVLRSVNALQGSRIIAGDSLLIPRSSDADLSTLAPAIRNSRNLGLNIPAQYTIKRGDSLWSIARRYNLKSKKIATWNQIALTQILRPGQTLDLQYATQGDPDFSQALLTEAQATYLVRSGDSMARIAKQFNLDLQDLLRWNGISINQLIYPGQTIQFQPQDSEIN